MELITSKEIFQTLKSQERAELKCLQCGKEFNRRKKDILDSFRRGGLNCSFCSSACSGSYRTNQKSKIVKCLFCNKEIIKRYCELKKSNNKPFCSGSCSALYSNSRRFPIDGSDITSEFVKPRAITHPQKSPKIKKSPILLTCSNCNKTFFKLYPNPKSKHRFCCRSCQAKYANRTWNRSARFGINKSRAESDLVKIITTDFPNLEIIENDRKILDGLELDVYIPSKNVAIELNGPCHYIPIFGEKELFRTQSKDIIKKIRMQEMKIHFFQINIMGAGKKLPEVLATAYHNQIKPLLI